MLRNARARQKTLLCAWSRHASNLAQELTGTDNALYKSLHEAAASWHSRNPAARVPSTHLPPLPANVTRQLDSWLEEAHAHSKQAQHGKKAYSLSMPLLISSQLGRVGTAVELADTMHASLELESATQDVSPSFRAWMLGRLLLASDQISDEGRATTFRTSLEGALDDIAAARVKDGSKQLEEVTDPFEAWAWAYLLTHYGGKDEHAYDQWLKTVRLTWASVEHAAGLAHLPSQHGNRMWINVLSLLALSTQQASGTVLASSDPLAKESMAEMYEDAELFFRYRHKPTDATQNAGIDLSVVASSQLSFSDAVRQIPMSDFRAWAVGLTRLAMTQANAGGQPWDGVLDKRFVKCILKSEQPADKALAVTNWLYARYVSIWKQHAVRGIQNAST